MVELTFTALGGDRGSRELLLLGPSLGTGVATLWEQCVPRLAEDREVVGWDLPGHGNGPSTTASFSIADLAAAVRGFAVEHGEGRRVRYAGVSVGGAVGFELALDPGPVADVATLASAPRIAEADVWAERIELVRRGGTSAVVAGSAQRWFAPGFAERQPRVVGRLLDELVAVDDTSYTLVCAALADFDLRERIGEARVPLASYVGEHDAVVPPSQLPEATVIRGVAHLPPAEDPATVIDDLEDQWATTTA
ncbi:alpha/beta fold hydrolase [Nocardioides mangrovicus]|nr:alpha/beta fold hydrolase [Nocardioides mangrovicus]